MSIPEINVSDISPNNFKFMAVNLHNYDESKEFTDLIKAQKWADEREKEGKNIDIITMSEWIFIQSNKVKEKSKPRRVKL